MPENDRRHEFGLLPEVGEFASLLARQGISAALAYLNRRTPHRYTGLFRFEGEELRTQVLVDGNQPARQPAPEVPLTTAYCALMGRQQAMLARSKVPADEVMASPLFYHSVLIHDAQGRAYGTLCHYDLQRCQPRAADQFLLETAATLLYAHCSNP